MNRLLTVIAITAILLAGVSPSRAVTISETPSVVFFLAIDDTENPWSKNVRAFAEAAAHDLNIDLEILISGARREEIRRSVHERINSSSPPDYVLFINHNGLGEELLRYFDENSIYTYLFIAGLSDAEYARVGRPGEDLKYWLGEIVPDDMKAGYDLAKHLIVSARKRANAPNKHVNLLAFTGSYSSTIANERVRGLKKAIAEDGNATLLQTVSARWIGSVASSKYKWLRKRYPDVDVVWSATDQMATAILNEDTPNGRPVIGGMDWTEEARLEIGRNRMDASMGGHFVDVAYALSAIAEHASGDWTEVSDLRWRKRKSELSLLTLKENSNPLYLFSPNVLDEFDFTKILANTGANGEQKISVDAFLQTQQIEGAE